MMKAKVSVAASFVGSGVFAEHEFKRGDIIGEVRGQVLAGEGDEYAIGLDDTFTLDPAAPFRFLNHSCRPNAEFFTDERKRGKHLRMFVGALRRIKLGEELTISYGWAAKDAVPCRCGTEKCLGWIVDPKQLHLVAPQAKPKSKPKPLGKRKSA
ncbi:MAG: SET domain-containing protein [Planctomycetia bacterium]|nr:SET domain-containing protein [Planctomycetia bacterium]